MRNMGMVFSRYNELEYWPYGKSFGSPDYMRRNMGMPVPYKEQTGHFTQEVWKETTKVCLLQYTFFIGNSIFHLSLELLTKFWKTSLKVA